MPHKTSTGPTWGTHRERNIAMLHITHVGPISTKYEATNVALPYIANKDTTETKRGGGDTALTHVARMGLEWTKCQRGYVINVTYHRHEPNVGEKIVKTLWHCHISPTSSPRGQNSGKAI